MDADDLAFVDFLAGLDHQAAALLHEHLSIGGRGAGAVGDHHAVLAFGDRAFGFRSVMVEHVEEQAGAGGDRAELGLEADQPARRDHEVDAHAALAVGFHVDELATTLAEALHHAALILFFEIDDERLERLHLLAVYVLDDDLGTRHREFVAFASHRFDQDRQVQFATARYLELVGVVGLLDLQRHVVLGLADQTIAQLARGQELAAAAILLARERRIVDLEGHADRRFVDGEHGQLLGRIDCADRFGNAEVADAGHRDDVAGLRLFDFATLKAHEAEHLQHLALARLAFAVEDGHGLVGLDLAALDAANADDADVVAVVERCHAHLERAVHVHRRRRDVLDDRVEQRVHVALAHVGRQARIAMQRRGVDDREVELLLGRAEAIEQVEGLVHDPVRARTGTVHLVHHDDRLEAHRERFLGHEARLRHRAVHRIDQDQHRVDHRQHALDFAAEVRMSRRVDDVDAVVLPADCGVLGKDRDATFLFEIVAVHHAFGGDRTLAEGAGLLEQLVDESGLAVVDVSDDGNIAELFNGHGNLRPAWASLGGGNECANEASRP